MPVKPQNDLSGKVFSRLRVIKYVKGGKWECRCDCGKITLVDTYNLTSGAQKSCGCYNLENVRKKRRNSKDLTGRTFGALEVIRYVKSGNQGTEWECRCNACGNTAVIPATYLKNYTSCGCLSKQACKNNLSAYHDQIRETKTNPIIFRVKPNSNNKTGVRGVCFLQKQQIYVAYIGYKGKHKTLKRSKDIQECIAARKEAEEKIRSMAAEEIEDYLNSIKKS